MNFARKMLARLRLCERRCAGCHAVFLPETPEDLLCNECLATLRETSHPARCGLCGTPLEAAATLCGECAVTPPPWDFFWTLGSYAGLLRTMILRAKFGGDFALLHALGQSLAHAMPSELPYAFTLTPIPLRPKRLRERGWNQSIEIAKELSKIRLIPLAPNLLERIRDTPSQKTLSATERVKNMRGAFRANQDARGRHILLVDDVMTTGSTLRNAGSALLEAGAASVAAVVLARD